MAEAAARDRTALRLRDTAHGVAASMWPAAPAAVGGTADQHRANRAIRSSRTRQRQWRNATIMQAQGNGGDWETRTSQGRESTHQDHTYTHDHIHTHAHSYPPMCFFV